MWQKRTQGKGCRVHGQRVAWIMVGIIACALRASGDDFGGRGIPVDRLAYAGEAPQAFFGEAQWLRDPRLEGMPPLPVFETYFKKFAETDKNREFSGVLSNDEGTEGLHTYFRREFTLAQKPIQATLYYSADDRAKIYLNGSFLDEGPPRSYPFAQPVVELEVTDALEKGDNVIAAHVYYHGAASRSFDSADNRMGLVALLRLTFKDGTVQEVKTDDSWRLWPSKTFSYLPERSVQSRVFPTQFNENMDLRLEPKGWRQSGFNDQAWKNPQTGFQDHRFTASPIPPLQRYRLDPLSVEQKGSGRWLFDFGHYVVGHPRVRVEGRAGQVMTVLQGEELLQPGDRGYGERAAVRYRLRANAWYEDQIVLDEGPNLIEFYDYRAFRYLEVLDAPSQPEVWVEVRHFPLDWSPSHFASSDETLNRIWEISKRTVQMICQDVVQDCAQREKGQYGGDTYITALAQLLLSDDGSLIRKALVDGHHSQHFNVGMLAVAPGAYWQELAEWSLVYPLMLEYYYRMTGDSVLVERLLEKGALQHLMGWFGRLENEDGLLVRVHERKSVLVDWPRDLRGEYDYEGTANGINTVANSFYYGALRAAAYLLHVVERSHEASVFEQKAARLLESFQRVLMDEESGLVLDGIRMDGTPSFTGSVHASAFALGFGLVPEKDQAAVVELIRRKGMTGGIYLAPYLLRGLWKSGEGELAYRMMTEGRKSWAEMLRHGSTTTSETWSPEDKANMGWAHPAAAVPVYFIVQHLMGLTPLEPGFGALHVTPQIPDALDWVELRFPTAKGPVEAVYKKEEGLTLTVPNGMRVVDASGSMLNVTVIKRE
jgi:alpha-L-rhamnosidase